MTNNIVAQFSCSIDKNGIPKEYPVVNGSIFNEEYNETLDSSVLLLSQVLKEDRLSLIKSYDFVRVFNKSSVFDVDTGTYDFDKIYLVDDFDEKENNITEHIFSYSINLMSETKILEKWQCPNVVNTHDLDEEGRVVKKTIYEYIDQYMKLYVPKMKFSEDGKTWHYRPVISWPKGKEVVKRNDEVTMSYDDSNLERHEHGGTVWYTLDLDIPVQNVSAEDFSTVELTDWWKTSEDLYDETVSYDENAGIFHFHALTNNPNDTGDISIEYSYEETVIFETEFFKRFNVPCADLPFNFPTLRQLLTALMQQVGCIPIVRNRVLGFLDFQKDAALFGNGDYTLGNTVNFIRRSLSSDSFVNTLVNTSEQVIDSGNEVICETIGFRDKNNVLLRQEENLKLETSLPIYKINKCLMHAPGKESAGQIISSGGCYFVGTQNTQNFENDFRDHFPWPIIFYCETSILNGTASIKFRVDRYMDNPNFLIASNSVYFLSMNNDGAYETLGRREISDITLNDETLINHDEFIFDNRHQGETGRILDSKSYTLTINNLPQGTTSILISGVFINNNNSKTKKFTFIRFDENDNNIQGQKMYSYGGWGSISGMTQPIVARFQVPYEVVGFKTWDITKLVVENSIRQTLETNFAKMATDISSVEDASVEKVSKYVYGTVGYSIGSKEISGFSETFTVGSGGISWIQKEYTYLENIVNVLEKGQTPTISDLVYFYFECLKEPDVYKKQNYYGVDNNSDYGQSDYSSLTTVNLTGFAFAYYNAGDNTFTGSKKFFTSFFFDIWYQPLNSFNLAYVKSKEDVDFPLEQFDSGASGVSDFDRLSIHEQEQVDRIGNETLTINQRTSDFSLIQDFSNGPLLFRDDTNRDGSIDEKDKGVDYIIFKRSFTVNNNCFNVTYVGAKDSVLKDYFTSIRTKYRAYQYVDYTSSVLRKERDTIFIRVSSTLYDGDNKIRLGNYGEKDYNDLSYLKNFMYDFNYSEEDRRPISYEIEEGTGIVPDGQSSSYEVQTVKNSVSSIVTNNMMGFIYEMIDNVGLGTYLREITKDENLGGIPQTWQIWGKNHNLKHKVIFSNKITFYPQATPYENDSEGKIKAQIARIERTPIINGFNYDTVFWVCDDNADNNSGRSFYKDASERINHTVQFIYYAPDKDVLLSERFIEGTPMIARQELPYNACYYSSNFELNELPHDIPEGDIPVGTNCVAVEENENKIPFLQVAFNLSTVVKMCHKDNATGKIVDIAVFRKSIETVDYQNYYFTINDTKTDYVLADYHGILFRKYKVTTYDGENLTGITGSVPVSYILPRTVEPLYDEED